MRLNERKLPYQLQDLIASDKKGKLLTDSEHELKPVTAVSQRDRAMPIIFLTFFTMRHNDGE